MAKIENRKKKKKASVLKRSKKKTILEITCGLTMFQLHSTDKL